MLIKGVTKKGDAIPLSPREALSAAVGIGLSQKNDESFVFWLGSKDIEVEASQFHVTTKPEDQYDAVAEGLCLVGKTRVKDDKFYVARKHAFKIHYRSAKDEIGVPHVEVTDFEAVPVETNPANLVGEVDRTNVSIQSLNGEMTPQSENVENVEPPAQTTPQQTQGGGRVNNRRNR